MQDNTQQLIKETVAHAKNAWGTEDSKIASMILDKMKGHIEHTIDDKMQPFIAEFREYVKDDVKWKAEVTPIYEIGKMAKNFGSVTITLLKAVVLIGAAVGVFYSLYKFIK